MTCRVSRDVAARPSGEAPSCGGFSSPHSMRVSVTCDSIVRGSLPLLLASTRSRLPPPSLRYIGSEVASGVYAAGRTEAEREGRASSLRPPQGGGQTRSKRSRRRGRHRRAPGREAGHVVLPEGAWGTVCAMRRAGCSSRNCGRRPERWPWDFSPRGRWWLGWWMRTAPFDTRWETPWVKRCACGFPGLHPGTGSIAASQSPGTRPAAPVVGRRAR